MPSMSYLYIDSDQQLADFCHDIETAEYCAVDTEFVREKTYYPILALIQIANEQHMACIDPLAINDFTPLIDLMGRQNLTKVFHSPSQDLEILFQHFSQVPRPVFDTQLAAAVLGYNHQIGYADLVHQITGVKLDKKHTRADWLKRPLSKEELDYAMDDVRYLLPLYRQLKADLVEKRRSTWIEKDLQAMSSTASYEINMTELWKRLKGVQKLKGVQLEIASKLCQWREGVAQKKDRPRRWIAKDDLLIEIARLQPASIEELSSIRELNEKFIAQHGQLILKIIRDAQNLAPSEWPHSDRVISLSSHQQAIGDCMTAMCRVIAEDNQIALATLAARKDIDNLIINRKNSRLSQGWRFALAGERLLEFIHGQSVLGVLDDQIEISPR
ncbi:MAG: ribonuclease D [Gammaproteobacteria bacterium]